MAAQAVRELAEELYPGVRFGMMYTIHTGGSDLGFKPHVHLVMTKGVPKDGEWVVIDKLLGGRLAAKWRYPLCKHLRQARPFDQKLRKAIDQGYHDHRGYQVKTDTFYPKGLDAAKYIGRYLGHPPLATSRIIDYDGQSVTYWYVDSSSAKHVTVACSALGFISRMIPHIPPREFRLCATPVSTLATSNERLRQPRRSPGCTSPSIPSVRPGALGPDAPTLDVA